MEELAKQYLEFLEKDETKNMTFNDFFDSAGVPAPQRNWEVIEGMLYKAQHLMRTDLRYMPVMGSA